MKKLVISAIALFSFVSASESVADKIAQCYTALSSGYIEFKAEKSSNGYTVYLKPKQKFYKQLLKDSAKIEVAVDEGPIITNPSFGFGKAGLSAKGETLSLFNPKISDKLKKNIKTIPKYNYKAFLNFGSTLKSETKINGFKILKDKVGINISDINIKRELNIDSCTGESDFKIDDIEIKNEKLNEFFKFKNIKMVTVATEKPRNNLSLFGKGRFEIGEVYTKVTAKGKKFTSRFKITGSSLSKRIDKDFMSSFVDFDITALDTDTIALLKGIKEIKAKYGLENFKIDAIEDFIKFSEKMEKLRDKMAEASAKNDDIALQKAIFEMNNLSSRESVKVFNEFFIKDKTRLKVDLELNSEKTSYIKLDLLYKADPIQDNIQSGMITLAAQNLAIVDGKFDVAAESTLITSINPMSLMVFDMLKEKGLATLKNGIYHIKGELKNGKVIINGKSYNMAQLSRVLF